MKHAEIYKKNGFFYFNSSYRTTVGVWIVGMQFLKIGPNPDHEELGAALVDILEYSKCGVPHPQQNEWKDVLRPLLEFVGVKSWSSFVKNMYCCTVVAEGDYIEFLPKKNIGSKGFVGVSGLDKMVVETKNSHSEIGRIIFDIFDRIKEFD